MFRAAVFVSSLWILIANLGAQEAAPPAIPAPTPGTGVGVPPPAAPGEIEAPAIAVPPPLPGQLQAMPPQTALPPPVQDSAAAPPPVPAVPVPAPSAPAPGSPALAPVVPLAKAKPGSSTSSTGQFIIHGDELTLRSALSSKCEDIAKDLRTLLKDKQPWVLPVVVLLNTGEASRKPGPAVSTAISQLAHGGFHIQVTVNMRPDLRPEDLRKELVRALLAERILREKKEITTKRNLLLPDWLFLGILEAGDYRQRARPSALFAAIFKSGKIFGIEEIIEAPASAIEDGLSRTIYQTSCCALVLALLDQPDGGLRMSKFLGALASDPRTERELLNQWYPNFAVSDASLNKWWSLQLATLASPSMSEPLSPEDTLAALEDALILRFQAKPSELPRTSRHTPAPKPAVAAAAAPFPTPAPAPLAAPRTPSPRPAPAPVAATKPSDAEIGAPPTEPMPDAEGQEENKRGFMSRLNPFAKRKSNDDELTEAIEAAAQAEVESAMPAAPAPLAAADSPPPAPEPAPAAESENQAQARKPLLDRWFGDDKNEPKKAPEAPAAPQVEAEPAAPQPQAPPAPKPATTKAPKPDAPTAEPTPAPAEPEAEKKRGLMNWFRGGKKDKEEAPAPAEEAPKEETTKGKKSASRMQQTERLEDLIRAGVPLVASIYQNVAVEAEAEEKPEEGKRFLGLFGKKKTKEEPAEPEAPQAPKEKPATPVPSPAPAPTPEPAPEKPAESTPAPTPEKTKRPGLRLNLFGGDDKKEEAAPKETEAEAPSPEEGAAAPMPEPTPAPAPTARPRPAPTPKAPAKDNKKDKNETAVSAAIPIEDYETVLKRKDLAKILERNVNALGLLQNRAAILFRPIVIDYIQAMEDILKGKTKGLDARLKALRARSQEAMARSNAVRDLLDVHEANDTPAMSGLFEDYLKLPKTIQNELPARTDPISKYLDALDKEFSKK